MTTFVLVFLLVDNVLSWVQAARLKERVAQLERRLNDVPLSGAPTTSAVDLMHRN
jgi:hypothetical protein